VASIKDDDLYDTTTEVTVSRDMGGVLNLARQQQAMLLVLSGARIGQRVTLDQAPVIIGRGSSCGLVLDADSVSRQHAQVEWSEGHHQLVDKGSTNGTFVNHQRIQSRVLSDGDQVQIGKALLKYLEGGNIEAMYHEEFERLMHHDGLTGARTKASFEEAFRVALMMARSTPKPISLVAFDLDHFKQVNDTHGHTAGDAVLQQLSKVVTDVVKDRYLFARVGGEEFAVLMEGEPLGVAQELAEQLRHAVQSSAFQFENTRIPVTLSLGVAQHADAGKEDAEAFYERTDQALYAAKKAGRNCARVG
jgi:diguanylate cyclase (GGDEF)-like protein